jgi:hypothetical protein
MSTPEAQDYSRGTEAGAAGYTLPKEARSAFAAIATK